MSAAGSQRANVLNAYRKLLSLVRLMPEKKRMESMTRIREEFRSNKGETSSDAIADLLMKANSSLGFLNIVTPKRVTKQGGKTTIIFGKNADGSTSLSSKKAMSNWHGGNMDPDQVSRHYNGLKRAGFRDNNHAKGVF